MKKITLLFIGIIFSVNGFGQITFQRTFNPIPTNWDSRSFTCQQTMDGNYIIGSYQPVPPQAHNIHLIKLDVNGDTLWTRLYDVTYTVCRSIHQTADSGFVLTGQTYNFSAGNIFLLKTDAMGNVLWVKTYGNDFYDCIMVRQTNDGGYILAGYTDWTVGDADMFLIKTDSVGNVQWSKSYGDQFDDWGYSICQTYDGGYALAGSYGYDVGIIKTDNSGNVQWNRAFGLGGNEQGRYIVQSADSGFVVAGEANNGGYLVKTDGSGNLVWSKHYSSMGGACVNKTSDGGYVVISSNYGAALMKVNATGNVSWARSYPGTVYSQSYSGQQTTDGGYFLTGETQNTSNINAVYAIKTDSLGNSGCSYTLNPTETTPATVVTTPAVIVTTLTVTSTSHSITTSRGAATDWLCMEDIDELNGRGNIITLFPNPATSEIRISDFGFRISQVEIFNTLGEKVYDNAEGFRSNAETINVSKLTSGIYFVRVKTSDGMMAGKFVKE